MTNYDLGDWRRREIRSAMLYLQDYLNARPLESPTILEVTLKAAIHHIDAVCRPEPDAYTIISAMPRHDEFIAEFRGRTVRCRKAEHVSIGRGYLMFVEGLVGVVSETETEDVEFEFDTGYDVVLAWRTRPLPSERRRRTAVDIPAAGNPDHHRQGQPRRPRLLGAFPWRYRGS